MTPPPYPPYPPFPPYPPSASPPPYPPFPPYAPALIVGGSAGPAGVSFPGSLSAQTGVQAPGTEPTSETEGVTPTKPFPGVDATNPLPIFFNYGRYDIVDVTNEGLGQDQNAKLNKFVADATSVRARTIIVDGFASPEDNLPNSQLPLNRANAVKNRLHQLFVARPLRPTITVRTTSVASGDQSTWPSLRRVNIYAVPRAI